MNRAVLLGVKLGLDGNRVITERALQVHAPDLKVTGTARVAHQSLAGMRLGEEGLGWGFY